MKAPKCLAVGVSTVATLLVVGCAPQYGWYPCGRVPCFARVYPPLPYRTYDGCMRPLAAEYADAAATADEAAAEASAQDAASGPGALDSMIPGPTEGNRSLLPRPSRSAAPHDAPENERDADAPGEGIRFRFSE